MIRYMIPLLGSYLSSGIMVYIIIPIFCLMFLAMIPSIVRMFFRS